MKIELKRKEAIEAIKFYYLLNSSIEEKGNMLLGIGRDFYDENSDKWKECEILKYKNNKCIKDNFNYNNLVTNEYIEAFFSDLFGVSITLIDKLDIKGERCVCCGYFISESISLYDTCPICMWEFTNTKEHEYSAPNHSTLAEYRVKFLDKKNEDEGNIKYLMFYR